MPGRWLPFSTGRNIHTFPSSVPSGWQLAQATPALVEVWKSVTASSWGPGRASPNSFTRPLFSSRRIMLGATVCTTSLLWLSNATAVTRPSHPLMGAAVPN